MAKFGYNIDKGISFSDPSKVVVTKPVQKEEKDKKDKKEEREERTVTITETSPPSTVITEEDDE